MSPIPYHMGASHRPLAWRVAAVCAIFISCFVVMADVACAGEISEAANNRDQIIEEIKPILSYIHRPIRIYYYSKSCSSEELPFPPISLTTNKYPGIEGLRQAFGHSANILLDYNGIVRIILGSPPEKILHTKIARRC